MGSKTFRSTAFKRAIDTGKVSTLSVDDLVKVWRVAEGDEKSISLADLAVGVTTNVEDLNTGFVYGLNLSINGADNTKFDIAAGEYVITDLADLDNIIVKIIKVTSPILAITPFYLATRSASYIAIDDTQTIIQSDSPFTDADRRSLAILGAVIHSNNININTTNEIKAPIVASTNQLHDLMRAIGSFNLEGNVYGAGTTGLRITKSAGEVFGLGINAHDTNDPHQLTIPLQTDLTFRYRLRNSTEYANTLVVDPNNYDLGGVLTTVPNNRFTVQRFNLFQSGLTRTQYGQVVYLNFEEAKLLAPAEPFEVEKNIADNAIFRAYLIVKKGITNLAAAIIAEEAAFIPVDKFGNVVTGGGSVLTSLAIITALGYTPESDANKVTDFSVVNDIVYPTTQAVFDLIGNSAGAGLSIDVDNKIQLGNDGAGIIDYSDDSVFTGGVQYIYNSADKSMSSLFADAEFRINTNWDSLIGSNSSSANIEIQSNVGSEARIDLTKTVNGLDQRMLFDPTTNLITITDSINSKGLENFGDYESNFTARSLVTKQYVTSAIGAINVLATPLTGYVVGANTALAATDTILGAFQQVQGQINARVSGTIASGQVAFGSGTNIISGENALWWDSTNDRLGIGTNSPSNDLEIRKGAQSNLQLAYTGQTSFTLSAVISGESRVTCAGSNNVFTIYTNSLERIRVANNGFIGIGTASPTAKFHVIGTDFPVISAERVVSTTTGFNSGNYFLTKTSGDMISGFGGGLVFAFQDSGYTPTSANSQAKIYPYIDGGDTLGAFSFRGGLNGNISILELRSSGNVGISTDSPTNTLDVNGTSRIRTISNGTGDFLTKSATGVITSRTAAEVITDLGLSTNYVTIATNQTITGAKVFNNALLVLSENNPVLRITSTSNTGTLNFRNVFGEDQAGIILDNPANKFSIATRVSNTDIEIAPHGTGSILLPNIASGTGDVLMLNGSNEVVKGSSSVDIYAGNESITVSGFSNVIIPTSDTEYAYTFSSFDRSMPIGTTYEFEFEAVVVWQNATSINDFRSIINITTNLLGQLSPTPTQVTFVNSYVFKVTVTRSADKWIQVSNCIGGSGQLDLRMTTEISFSTNYIGLLTPKLGLKTPISSFTSGDYIQFKYMKKTRIK